MATEGSFWRVGELAKATGLSVRALHHYDEIGLLQPVRRTGAGHRLYDERDVRRLHRILALRGFGLSLTEVGQVLAGELGDPRDLIRRQLEQVQGQIAAAEKLRTDLGAVLDALDQAREPSVEMLIELMEGMTTMTKRLTVEEFEEMTQHRLELLATMTEEEIAAAQQARQQWRAIQSEESLAAMEASRKAALPEQFLR